jgi:hypothetical protein
MADIWGHGAAASQRVALPELAASRRSAPHAVNEAGGSLLLVVSPKPAVRRENHRIRVNASKLLFVRKIDFKASALSASCPLSRGGQMFFATMFALFDRR